jgi:hypothetical protein
MSRRQHQTNALLLAHGLEFDDWPAAAVYALRCLHGGEWMDAFRVVEVAEVLGLPVSYSSARGGTRWLAGECGPWVEDRTIFATFPLVEQRTRNSRRTARLTASGRNWADLSFQRYPADLKPLVEPRTYGPPPDPVTPLWRVLGDGTTYLVIAGDAQEAMQLVETEHEGEIASRAIAVPTDDPLILGFEPA